MWIVDRLISLNIKGCDGLLVGLLRQFRPGDRTDTNIWVIKSVVNLVKHHLNWLKTCPSMIPYVVYSLLRMLSESNLDNELLQTISDICLCLLQEKFTECSQIGRDLARCLIEVARLEEFRELWRWLISPTDEDGMPPIVRIVLKPTPKKYLVMRLPPNVESQLQFLLSVPKSTQQNFYIPLYIQSCIPTADGSDRGAAVVDLIRYIVAAYCPSNSGVSSAAIQRWSLVQSLLKSLDTNYASASAKLALFLDWFFFDPSIDNVMHLEAALLVMVKSIVNYPHITATLIEFLILMKSSLYPYMSAECSACVNRAFQCCIDEGIIPSIDVISASPLLSDDIRGLCKELFLTTDTIPLGGPPKHIETVDPILTLQTKFGSLVSKDVAETTVKEWISCVKELSTAANFEKEQLRSLTEFVNEKLSGVLLSPSPTAAHHIWIEALESHMPELQDIIVSGSKDVHNPLDSKGDDYPSSSKDEHNTLESNSLVANELILRYIEDPTYKLRDNEREILANHFHHEMLNIIEKDRELASDSIERLLILTTEVSISDSLVADLFAALLVPEWTEGISKIENSVWTQLSLSKDHKVRLLVLKWLMSIMDKLTSRELMRISKFVICFAHFSSIEELDLVASIGGMIHRLLPDDYADIFVVGLSFAIVSRGFKLPPAISSILSVPLDLMET